MDAKFLSKQARSKTNYTTPLQDICRAGQVHDEVFGTGLENRIVTSEDWDRLDEANRKARVARNFIANGTYDKNGND